MKILLIWFLIPGMAASAQVTDTFHGFKAGDKVYLETPVLCFARATLQQVSSNTITVKDHTDTFIVAQTNVLAIHAAVRDPNLPQTGRFIVDTVFPLGKNTGGYTQAQWATIMQKEETQKNGTVVQYKMPKGPSSAAQAAANAAPSAYYDGQSADQIAAQLFAQTPTSKGNTPTAPPAFVHASTITPKAPIVRPASVRPALIQTKPQK